MNLNILNDFSMISIEFSSIVSSLFGSNFMKFPCETLQTSLFSELFGGLAAAESLGPRGAGGLLPGGSAVPATRSFRGSAGCHGGTRAAEFQEQGRRSLINFNFNFNIFFLSFCFELFSFHLLH